MGAWGMGLFENDSACDMTYQAVEGSADAFIKGALNRDDPEYLDADEGVAMTVAGVILANRLKGAGVGTGQPEFDAWVAGLDAAALAKWLAPVIEALKSVLAEDSELNELWEEAEEDYAEWRATITGLIEKLEAEE